MIRYTSIFALIFASTFTVSEVQAQRSQKKDADFIKSRPAVGDSLPDARVATSDGNPFQTGSLRGNYTVLVFGCLT